MQRPRYSDDHRQAPQSFPLLDRHNEPGELFAAAAVASEDTSDGQSVNHDPRLSDEGWQEGERRSRDDISEVSDQDPMLEAKPVAQLVKRKKAISCLIAVLPSFVAYRFFRTPVDTSPAGEWHPTSFLDGLRGVACIAVFHLHVISLINKWHPDGWGLQPYDTRLLQMPIFRLAYGGNLAVAVFFVISGFALSLSTIKLMHAQKRDFETFAKLLGSSIFRRPIRLLLPALISTIPPFICYLLRIYAGFEPMRTSAFFDGWPRQHVANETIGLQVLDFIREDARMLNIFDPGTHNRYNGPTWTITYEFRASLILYLTQAALFSFSRRLSWTLLILASICSILYSQTEMPLFWAGFILAERFHLAQGDSQAATGTSTASRLWRFTRSTLMFTAFFCCLWLGSFPEFQGSITPGFMWIGLVTPPLDYSPDKWWQHVAAVGIVGILSACPCPSDAAASGMLARIARLPRAFLSSPVCRYMGKISFSLYLNHYLLLDTWGVFCFYGGWTLLGVESAFGFWVGFICAYALLLAVVVWAADVFWRLVDQPCVELARWAQRKCSSL